MGGRAATGHGLSSGRWVGKALELALANSLDAIKACRPDLQVFFELNGLRPIVANRVDVVFEELVSNAIRHGFTPGSDQSLRVALRASRDCVELTIEDDGRPFNPLRQVEPPTLNSLEKAALGGLGIPLIRKLAASIRYESPASSQAIPGGSDFRPTNRIVVTLTRPSIEE